LSALPPKTETPALLFSMATKRRQSEESALAAELLQLLQSGQKDELRRRLSDMPKAKRKRMSDALASSPSSLSNVLGRAEQAQAKAKAQSGPNNADSAPAGHPFTTKALEGLLYAAELWDMLAGFGDASKVGRDRFRCTCSARGQKKCSCLDSVRVVSHHVQKYTSQVVDAARHESNTVTMSSLIKLKPLEMSEYLSWCKAKKESREKEKAPLASNRKAEGADSDGDEAAVPELEDDDPMDDEEEEEEDDDEITEELEGLCDIRASGKARLLSRKRFADSRTIGMSKSLYDEFVSQRNTFFVGMTASRKDRPSVASKELNLQGQAFLSWLGFPRLRTSRSVLQAVAFLAHDQVGCIVEEALRVRSSASNGGGGGGGSLRSLQELPPGDSLTATELESAAASLQGTCGLGLSCPGIGSVQPQYSVGLHYYGTVGCWPRNVTQNGRILQEGGTFIDISRLGKEAEALMGK
jgi:hypothetical protein